MTIRIDTLLSELSAYFVRNFGLSPREAAGLVMQSPVAEEIQKKNSPFQQATVEELADRILCLSSR